ncbi:MAG TPA: hypothetical protein VN944_10330 [Nitrospiria bacterium]|nr:hypothetical protein [Nitrospiria bacterium]
MKVAIGRIGDQGMDAILEKEEVMERNYDERARSAYIKDHFYHGTKRLKGVIPKSGGRK